jgi:hypothetical protein
VPKPEAARPETSYAMSTPMPTTPPGRPSGSVLDFGRYAGWSLGQIAIADPVYLEWLARTPIGRSFNREIHALLATRTRQRRPLLPSPRPSGGHVASVEADDGVGLHEAGPITRCGLTAVAERVLLPTL